jgi:hypothetical protein
MLYFIAVSLSFNQPKFCPNAVWYTSAVLFANASFDPHAVFVHVNDDTVYVTVQGTNCVQIWSNGSGIPTRTISNDLNNPGAIFVTINGDIYVDSGNNHRVEMWTWNATNGVVVMNVSVQCMGLFIDNNNTLYCSDSDKQKVIARSLSIDGSPTTLVAGNGTLGSASNQLCDPNGLFVDVNFNLYVADWCNSRIQKFAQGQVNGITVAGSGAPGTISLLNPIAVTLDGNGYLFILDSVANRLVGSGPNGFRCLVGCSGTYGPALYQFNTPNGFGFDSYGNLIVSDRVNNRILKFILAINSCGKFGLSLTNFKGYAASCFQSILV